MYVCVQVLALYPYSAQNADELSFEKDDIIAVTDRSQDPAWWQGAYYLSCIDPLLNKALPIFFPLQIILCLQASSEG